MEVARWALGGRRWAVGGALLEHLRNQPQLDTAKSLMSWGGISKPETPKDWT